MIFREKTGLFCDPFCESPRGPEVPGRPGHNNQPDLLNIYLPKKFSGSSLARAARRSRRPIYQARSVRIHAKRSRDGA